MKVLISPTAFKGTLTPHQAARLIQRVIAKHQPSWEMCLLPLADGGDGTLEVLSRALKGRSIRTTVTGPLGKKVLAPWCVVDRKNFSYGKTAIIEMARASGLALTKGNNKIMVATSFGTGQLIKAALDLGCRTIFIGVGGTATAEGGAGALRALGFRYFDNGGNEVSEKISDLLKVDKVDRSRIDKRLFKTKIFVLCDVTNPLLGARGSARTFGPQKGASPTQVRVIEKALRHWSRFAKSQTQNVPGAGAAGALAFGLSGFIGARLVKGAPFVMNVLRWKKLSAQSDVIVTGEGQIDKTSFSGKVIGEITEHRKKAKVVAACGKSTLSKNELRRRGVQKVIVMGPKGLNKPEQSLKKAASTLISNSLFV